MDDRPLSRPEHLRAGALPPAAWLAKRAAGMIALGLGVISFLVVAVCQHGLWATPDWRVSVPGCALTAAASVASIVRREPASVWWLLGLGLAAVAIVLGWFLMMAVVLAVTATAILVLHSVL